MSFRGVDMKKLKKKICKNTFTPFAIALLVVLLVYTLSIFGLLFWTLITSLKSNGEFMTNSYGLPTKLNFSNFSLVFSAIKVPAEQYGSSVNVT